jgi:hypothetical protein
MMPRAAAEEAKGGSSADEVPAVLGKDIFSHLQAHVSPTGNEGRTMALNNLMWHQPRDSI